MTRELAPPSYGVLRRRELADAFDGHVEEVDIRGFTLVDSGLDAAALEGLRQGAEGLHQAQAAMASEGFEPDRDIVRCPLAEDDRFLDVATLPVILDIARRLMGETSVLLQQNVIFNQPAVAQYQSRWHRDLPYQHFTASERLAISVLLCLEDFTAETGGTVVIPGSHRLEEFPSTRFVAAHEGGIEARAGSLIVMDAMIYHRTGVNRSPRVRRGINHVIGRPFLVQQIDIPRQLDGRLADDPKLASYLGYRWNPAPDVATWRSRRS